MSKWPNREGKHWTSQEVKAVKKMAGENTPTRVIALKAGRSVEAVYKKASEESISLKPTNQSPYNRRKA